MRASGRSNDPVHHDINRRATRKRHDQVPSGHFFNGPIESLVWEQRKSVRRTGQEVALGPRRMPER